MPIHIETERLVLRRFAPDDAEALQEIFGDALVMENVEPPYDLEKTKKFLNSFCIEHGGALACCLRESGRLIGYILFNEYEKDVYEAGWIFNKNFWRRGYAFEALSALLAHAFSVLGAHKVFAEAIDGVKSVGLMKKLGLRHEGTQRSQTRNNAGQWCDLYFYGLLKEEYDIFGGMTCC